MSLTSKRKRVEPVQRPRKRKHLTREPASKRGPAVKSDNLHWREVEISKHLDDAEGFFGLEELSDVEVVRDESGQTLFFQQQPIHDVKAKNRSIDDSDNWFGFDDVESHDIHDEGELHVRSNNAIVEPLPSKSHQSTGTKYEELSLAENVQYSLLNEDVPEPEADMSQWNDLNISAAIRYALSTLQFATPTAIQQLAIPHIIAGRDVIGKAVTGSGKTLAFGIPIIESWIEESSQQSRSTAAPTALILSPTRELAHQISSHLAAVCRGLDTAPRLVTVTGGLSILKQQRQLRDANVIVATPGRLWEVINESNDLLEKLKEVRFLVVDEADRLLSEGHFREFEEILELLDRESIDEEDHKDQDAVSTRFRQTLVFSATFHKGLHQKLSKKKKKGDRKTDDLLSDKQSMEYLMHKLPFQPDSKPVFVDASPDSQMAESLSETILECKGMEKDLYLYGFLLQDHNLRRLQSIASSKSSGEALVRILIFTNSVSSVKRLVPLLQSLEMPATTISPLHSNMPQKSRLRSLERFSNNVMATTEIKTSILVATDVAARGLDIKGITTIIHYHVPRTADAYVHRSGRTARVGASGRSILICSPDEIASVTKLISKIHKISQRQDLNNVINRMYLPNELLRQITSRLQLAQKIIEASQSTEKTKSEDNWLRNAAEELGVDYDSDEYELASRSVQRGRGGGKKARKEQTSQAKVGQWKSQLREQLAKRINFGDDSARNGKYIAGGAYDFDQLLAERSREEAVSY